MRNLKKVIAFVAVFAMTISCVAFGATFTDVAEGTAQYEAVETLSALGILNGYPEGTFKPGETISRAEFAAVVCRAKGWDNLTTQADTAFTDVPKSYWGSGYIKMATDQGIVNGMGDGTFAPDAPVLYEQAVKMIMVALGYEPKASQEGGYPTGYLVSASGAKVTTGLGGDVGQGANRGLVAQLMNKGIDTPIMLRVTYGTEVSYQIQDGTGDVAYRTLMSENLGVTKLKGQVASNSITDLAAPISYSNTSTKAETVKVNVDGNFKTINSDYQDLGTTAVPYHTYSFRVGKTNANALIGQRVILYAKEESSMDEDLLISIVPEAGKNEKVTFNLDQFDSIEGSSTAPTKILYFKNKDTDRNPTELQLNTTTAGAAITDRKVIANGRADAFGTWFNGSIVAPNSQHSGQVTVVDSDNDGRYDFISVEVPEIFVVDTVGSNGTVTTLNGANNLKFNKADDTTLRYTITKDGKAIEYTDLAKYDVLSVVRNRKASSDNVFDVRVISNKVTGTVGEQGTDVSSAESKTFKIDGKEYKLALNYYSNGPLKPGVKGDFYIDEYGRIAAYVKGIGLSDNYAYITKTKEDTAGFSAKFQAEYLDKDGVLQIKNFAKNVTIAVGDAEATIKGETLKAASSADYTADMKIPAAGTGAQTTVDTTTEFKDALAKQLAKVELNGSNEIYRVELPKVTTSVDEDYFIAHGGLADKMYDAKSERLGSQDISEDTKIFHIVTTGTGAGTVAGDVDSDECSVVESAGLTDGTTYSAQFFDKAADLGDAPRIVLIYSVESTLGSNNFAVVQSIGSTVNAEGEKVGSITYTLNGALETKTTTTDVSVTGLATGEAVKLSFKNGAINSITKLFKVDSAATAVSGTATDVSPADKYNGSPFVSITGAKITAAAINNTEAGEANLDTADASGKTKYYYGPVISMSSGRLKLVPQKMGVTDITGYDQTANAGKNRSFTIPSSAFVYVYDASKSTAAAKLKLADLGEIFTGSSNWEIDETLSATNAANMLEFETGMFIAKPAFGVRDWAVVRTYDDKVTEVYVIKAHYYKGL